MRVSARRRAGCVLALLLGLAGLSGSPLPAGAAERPTLDVLLDELTPLVVRPGVELVLGGRVVNRGPDVLREVGVRLRAQSQRLSSRGAIASAATGEGPFGQPIGETTPVVDELAPGRSAPWRVVVPAERLPFGQFGVHLVGIDARAASPEGGTTTVETMRTFLPWVPAGTRLRPTRLALVWPLTGTPVRGPTSTYLVDDIGAALGSRGELGALLAAGVAAERPDVAAQPAGRRAVPLIWAVDPALVDAVADMQDGYRIRRPTGGGTSAGAAADAATEWLRAAIPVLTRAMDERRLVTLPYADPDVVALHRGGLGDDVTAAVARGAERLRGQLGRSPAADVAWPVGGFITPEALAALPPDTRAVLLSEQALPLSEPGNATPGARTAVTTSAGTRDALLTDSVLSALLAVSRPGDIGPIALQRLASPLGLDGRTATNRQLLQRYVAETAMITAERPSRPRDILVAPPHHWRPDADFAAGLLEVSATAPWLEPVDLGRLLSGASDYGAREALRYPATAQRAELAPAVLTELRGIRSRLRDFRAILPPEHGDEATTFDLALLRAESAQWREQPDDGERLRAELDRGLSRTVEGVRIISRGLVTLTSRTGAVPVTLANDLRFPVQVRLKLTGARSQARLTSDESEVRTVAPGNRVIVRVEARALTSGVFPVEAQLLTPDGRPYGAPVTLRVRSTAYDSIAVAITTGALVVLFLAVAVRLTRRGLRAAHRARRAASP